MTPKNHTLGSRILPTLVVVAGSCAPVLAEEYLFSLAASSSHLELGSSFASAGDLNGDGVVDIALADRSARVSGFIASGSVQIINGTDGSLIRNHVGRPADSQSFGSGLAALDANGDGVPDLAVGAPGYSPVGASLSGSVTIYSGLDGSELCFVAGSAGDQLGSNIANAGDQDGDLRDDLFVSALGANAGKGTVFVISGASGANLRSHTTSSSASSFGMSLVTVSDIDEDGRPDLAVGAPGFRVSGNQAGRVYLIRSSDGATAAFLTGTGSYNRLGESIAPARDANGDGYHDLMVGSYNGGTGLVLSGRDLTTLVNLSVAGLPAYRQLTVGGTMDFDQDGALDWLIGSPGLALVNGKVTGGIRVVSGADQSTLFQFDAAGGYTGLGLVVKALPGIGFGASESYVKNPITGGYGLAHFWKVEEVPPVIDSDGDGIPDDVDAVVNSIMDPTVHLLGRDSGVANPTDETGTTLADRFAALGATDSYGNVTLHYVAILHLANELLEAGIIDKESAKALQFAALAGKNLAVKSKR